MADLRQADIAGALGVSRTRVAIIEGSVRVTAKAAAAYLRAVDELLTRAAR